MQKSKFVAEGAVGSAGEIGFVTSYQNSNLDCSFHSSTVHGKNFSITFEKAGRYQIFCNVVPNMIGTVIVSLWSLMRQKR